MDQYNYITKFNITIEDVIYLGNFYETNYFLGSMFITDVEFGFKNINLFECKKVLDLFYELKQKNKNIKFRYEKLV